MFFILPVYFNAMYWLSFARNENLWLCEGVEKAAGWSPMYKDFINRTCQGVSVVNSTHITQCASAHDCIGYHLQSINEMRWSRRESEVGPWLFRETYRSFVTLKIEGRSHMKLF